MENNYRQDGRNLADIQDTFQIIIRRFNSLCRNLSYACCRPDSSQPPWCSEPATSIQISNDEFFL